MAGENRCEPCVAGEPCRGGLERVDSVCDVAVPGRVWCTGFEGDSAAELSVLQTTDGGVVAVVDEPVRRGSAAGRASSPGNAGARNNEFFLRSGLSLGNVVHATFWVRRHGGLPFPTTMQQAIRFFDIYGQDADRGGKTFEIAMNPAGRLIVVIQQTDTSTGVTDFEIPEDEWVCMRFEFRGEATGRARVWIFDSVTGREVEEELRWAGADVDMRLESGYQEVHIGLVNNHIAADFVFDDVAIGSAPQPCE